MAAPSDIEMDAQRRPTPASTGRHRGIDEAAK
jgi:hypothetical protein